MAKFYKNGWMHGNIEDFLADTSNLDLDTLRVLLGEMCKLIQSFDDSDCLNRELSDICFDHYLVSCQIKKILKRKSIDDAIEEIIVKIKDNPDFNATNIIKKSIIARLNNCMSIGHKLNYIKHIAADFGHPHALYTFDRVLIDGGMRENIINDLSAEYSALISINLIEKEINNAIH